MCSIVSPIRLSIAQGHSEDAIVPLKDDAANEQVALHRIKVEVVMIDSPRLVSFEVVDNQSVLVHVGEISETFFAPWGRRVDNLIRRGSGGEWRRKKTEN